MTLISLGNFHDIANADIQCTADFHKDLQPYIFVFSKLCNRYNKLIHIYYNINLA